MFALTLPAMGGVIRSHFLDLVIPLHSTGDTRILPGSVSNNPFFGGVGLVDGPVFRLVPGGPHHPHSIEKPAIGHTTGGRDLSSTFHDQVADRGAHGETSSQYHRMVLPKDSSSTTMLGSRTHGDRIYLRRGILVLSTLGPIANMRDDFFGRATTLDILNQVRNQRMNSMVFACKVFGTLSISTRLTIGRPQVVSNLNSDLSLGSLATYSRADAGELTLEPNSTDMGDIEEDYTIRAEVILNLVQLGTHTASEIWKIPSMYAIPGDG